MDKKSKVTNPRIKPIKLEDLIMARDYDTDEWERRIFIYKKGGLFIYAKGGYEENYENNSAFEVYPWNTMKRTDVIEMTILRNGKPVNEHDFTDKEWMKIKKGENI